MSNTKIIQYIHRPNMTELGMGNTHETYLLVDSKTDMSKVFPPGKEVTVDDPHTKKSYVLKSSKPSEFRINQMGPIYRDYNIMPGDEIVITHYESEDEIKNVLTVNNFARVCLVTSGGKTEIINFDRLHSFLQSDNTYSLKLNVDGYEKTIKIVFLESKKKRSDSPNETDYYKVTLDDIELPNGKYYLTVREPFSLIPSLPKSEYNQVILEENYYPLKLNKKEAQETDKQIIYYGSPGTGKSFEINRLTKGKEVIRTTFHPDSDYSTFVGAYKPTSIEVPVRDVTGKVIVENGKQVTENRIVYEFVEQAFLQAYTKAWFAYAKKADGEKAKEQYLVIEEINRGNCAQIFGDLFQLLDRNGYGFSEYPITADKDMKKQLSKAFKDLTIADAERINGYYEKNVVDKVLSGDILLLPDNLYIWATMNTSDQSLFPIDSAFKRRWDWKYIPISEGKENGVSLGWKIKVNGKLFDWWQFIEKINAEIDEQTKSEDKKLGYFFCKAQDGIVSAETFVSKVVFYLWNDVFKDQDVASIFSDGDEELSFSNFYDTDVSGKTIVKEDKVEVLLQNLGVEIVVEKTSTNDVEDDDEDDDENNESSEGRDYSKFSVNGVGFYGKNILASECMKEFIKLNPNMSADEVLNTWKVLGTIVPHFVESKTEHDSRTDKSTRFTEILCNGSEIYVERNGYGANGAVDKLIEAVNQQNWGITLAKVEQ